MPVMRKLNFRLCWELCLLIIFYILVKNHHISTVRFIIILNIQQNISKRICRKLCIFCLFKGVLNDFIISDQGHDKGTKWHQEGHKMLFWLYHKKNSRIFSTFSSFCRFFISILFGKNT
jgi:hypothetical protein